MLSLQEFKATFPLSIPREIGIHASGCSNLSHTVSNMENTSLQVFLTPMRGSFPNYNTGEIRDIISRNNLIMFSHLPYFINLCYPATKMYTDPIVSLNSVIRELRIANDMSFRGCVIHVGKNTKKLEISDAINEMKYYILWCIIHATEKCPLLLETCCGCGTELLSDLYDFCKFYKKVIRDFPGYYIEAYNQKPDMKCPFGVCIDLAHVFAAGYNPTEAINIISNEIGHEAIKLIHFNDSREKIGSRKDRHEIPGLGNIDINEIYSVYQYAIEHDIAMIGEW